MAPAPPQAAVRHRAHGLPGAHCLPKSNMMGQTQWQPPEPQRLGGRHHPPVHRCTALSVQRLACAKIALGCGNDIGVEADRRAGRFATQSDARNADAEFEAD